METNAAKARLAPSTCQTESDKFFIRQYSPECVYFVHFSSAFVFCSSISIWRGSAQIGVRAKSASTCCSLIGSKISCLTTVIALYLLLVHLFNKIDSFVFTFPLPRLGRTRGATKKKAIICSERRRGEWKKRRDLLIPRA